MLTIVDEGGGGVQEPLILADVICEQPLKDFFPRPVDFSLPPAHPADFYPCIALWPKISAPCIHGLWYKPKYYNSTLLKEMVYFDFFANFFFFLFLAMSTAPGVKKVRWETGNVLKLFVKPIDSNLFSQTNPNIKLFNHRSGKQFH